MSSLLPSAGRQMWSELGCNISRPQDLHPHRLLGLLLDYFMRGRSQLCAPQDSMSASLTQRMDTVMVEFIES